jgi:hypothetical protein
MNCECKNFKSFVDSINGLDPDELLWRTEKEATAAERCRYRRGVSDEDRERFGIQYADILKKLIFFMRYGIKPSGLTDEDLKLFRRVCKKTHPNQ